MGRGRATGSWARRSARLERGSDSVSGDQSELRAVLEEHISSALCDGHTDSIIRDHSAGLVIHTELHTTAAKRKRNRNTQSATDSDFAARIKTRIAQCRRCSSLTSFAANCTTAENGAFSGTVTLAPKPTASGNSRGMREQSNGGWARPAVSQWCHPGRRPCLLLPSYTRNGSFLSDARMICARREQQRVQSALRLVIPFALAPASCPGATCMRVTLTLKVTLLSAAALLQHTATAVKGTRVSAVRRRREEESGAHSGGVHSFHTSTLYSHGGSALGTADTAGTAISDASPSRVPRTTWRCAVQSASMFCDPDGCYSGTNLLRCLHALRTSVFTAPSPQRSLDLSVARGAGRPSPPCFHCAAECG